MDPTGYKHDLMATKMMAAAAARRNKKQKQQQRNNNNSGGGENIINSTTRKYHLWVLLALCFALFVYAYNDGGYFVDIEDFDVVVEEEEGGGNGGGGGVEVEIGEEVREEDETTKTSTPSSTTFTDNDNIDNDNDNIDNDNNEGTGDDEIGEEEVEEEVSTTKTTTTTTEVTVTTLSPKEEKKKKKQEEKKRNKEEKNQQKKQKNKDSRQKKEQEKKKQAIDDSMISLPPYPPENIWMMMMMMGGEGEGGRSITPPPTSTGTSIIKYDILDRSQLLELGNQQKQVLYTQLYKDYGQENFENMFLQQEDDADAASSKNNTTTEERNIRNVIGSINGNVSVNTLKRKFIIKILEVQIETIKKLRRRRTEQVTRKMATATTATMSDVHNDDDDEQQQREGQPQRKLRLDPNNNNIELENIIDYSNTPLYTKLTWATGGHSASAGHGNMYNESYTAYMARDMIPIFAKFGIDFDARNYAMGGSSSGYEISSCFPQIFGHEEIDIFSWDYGMTTHTDGPKLHYIYRGVLSNSNPTFVGIRMKNPNFLPQLADNGLSAFVHDKDEYNDLIGAIPDSAGKTDAQINEMPFYIRNLKCEDKIENGDPYCKDEKYTKYYCSKRTKRVHWHPGFKSHAIDGHVLSLFLMHTFVDALKDLSDHDEKDPEILLDQLKQEEMKLVKRFADSLLTDAVKDTLKPENGFDKDFLETFYKGNGICRTGRLPARSRFLGYMTDSGMVGDIAPFGNETYDVGTNRKFVAEAIAASKEEMIFLRKDLEDSECTRQIVAPDGKNVWATHGDLGWVKFPAFPNEKEKEAYGYNKSDIKGLLLIKLGGCAWGKCSQDDVRLGDGKAGDKGDSPLENGTLEMTVNGGRVVSVLSVGKDLLALVSESGSIYWEPRASGDYEIAALVNGEGKSFRIAAVVLY